MCSLSEDLLDDVTHIGLGINSSSGRDIWMTHSLHKWMVTCGHGGCLYSCPVGGHNRCGQRCEYGTGRTEQRWRVTAVSTPRGDNFGRRIEYRERRDWFRMRRRHISSTHRQFLATWWVYILNPILLERFLDPTAAKSHVGLVDSIVLLVITAFFITRLRWSHQYSYQFAPDT